MAEFWNPAALGRPNLTAPNPCLVTRLLIRAGRCAGAYLRDGTEQQAHASAEVIVCADAIGSPQLLMLSGIGPAGHLSGLGISPVADLPGVGGNLQDHPAAMACFTPAAPLPHSRYKRQRHDQVRDDPRRELPAPAALTFTCRLDRVVDRVRRNPGRQHFQ